MTLLPLVLLLLGFPIFVILLSASAVAILGYYSVPATAIPQVMFGQLDSAVLLAVPFFILAGELMGAGSISKRLVSWAQAFLGWMKAGLPLTTILSTIVFGAISGSSAAT